jgi:cobalt-zinc-cadmium efflux system protein
VAGFVIYLTGWGQADAVATLVVAALMAVAAYRLLRDSARIFLEASPRGIEPDAVEEGIRGVNGVTDVHELHVWEVTSGFPALSAHVLVESGADCHERRLAIEEVLGDRFGIDHTTLQVDHRTDVLPTSALGQRLHAGTEDHPHH